MTSKVAKKASVKQGDWVRVTRSNGGSFRKGMIAVVCGAEPYTNAGYVYLVRQDAYGESVRESASMTCFRKISAPQYTVAWSTQYTDPVCYFESVSGARAFAKMLAKRRGEYKRAVEIGIFKRV